jgi:hypothetical protein
MKNLITKLAIPLTTISFMSFNPVSSKAQDFLPKEILNYRENYSTKILADKKRISNNEFFESIAYDIDGNNLPNVIEINYIVALKDTVIRFPYPLAYFIYLNSEDEKSLMFRYDPKMDGLGENDRIFDYKNPKKIKPIL